MFAQSLAIDKYPRTPHLEGSRLQPGDDDADQMPLAELAGGHAVIEEKLDGANCGISFGPGAELLLQSRGHYLTGGASERQFNLMKPWAQAHEAALLERLEDRYVMYGEWMFAKHSVWYDRLPHYFCEFDILDRHTGQFLSTRRRRELLRGAPVLSVPVLYDGPMPVSVKLLRQLVRPSLAKTPAWRQAFEHHVAREKQPLDLCWQQTDKADESEGLYLKIEDDNHVLARCKFVRHGFVQTILDSGTHHSRRPILPNLLAGGVDLYAARPAVTWADLGLTTLTSLDQLGAKTGAQK